MKNITVEGADLGKISWKIIIKKIGRKNLTTVKFIVQFNIK